MEFKDKWKIFYVNLRPDLSAVDQTLILDPQYLKFDGDEQISSQHTVVDLDEDNKTPAVAMARLMADSEIKAMVCLNGGFLSNEISSFPIFEKRVIYVRPDGTQEYETVQVGMSSVYEIVPGWHFLNQNTAKAMSLNWPMMSNTVWQNNYKPLARMAAFGQNSAEFSEIEVQTYGLHYDGEAGEIDLENLLKSYSAEDAYFKCGVYPQDVRWKDKIAGWAMNAMDERWTSQEAMEEAESISAHVYKVPFWRAACHYLGLDVTQEGPFEISVDMDAIAQTNPINGDEDEAFKKDFSRMHWNDPDYNRFTGGWLTYSSGITGKKCIMPVQSKNCISRIAEYHKQLKSVPWICDPGTVAWLNNAQERTISFYADKDKIDDYLNSPSSVWGDIGSLEEGVLEDGGDIEVISSYFSTQPEAGVDSEWTMDTWQIYNGKSAVQGYIYRSYTAIQPGEKTKEQVEALSATQSFTEEGWPIYVEEEPGIPGQYYSLGYDEWIGTHWSRACKSEFLSAHNYETGVDLYNSEKMSSLLSTWEEPEKKDWPLSTTIGWEMFDNKAYFYGGVTFVDSGTTVTEELYGSQSGDKQCKELTKDVMKRYASDVAEKVNKGGELDMDDQCATTTMTIGLPSKPEFRFYRFWTVDPSEEPGVLGTCLGWSSDSSGSNIQAYTEYSRELPVGALELEVEADPSPVDFVDYHQHASGISFKTIGKLVFN